MAKKKEALAARAERSQTEMEEFFSGCARVSMRLYRDPELSEDDPGAYAEAAINGHVFLVQRGKTVEVPAPLYLLFKQAGERFDVE
ncbi:MAG: hypothetical protein LBN04_05835 [Oscillospiraceae bacterium]|jgi:hypothetical protein|nr:hypothetical protein [Oscillospiraceae bacterium]